MKELMQQQQGSAQVPMLIPCDPVQFLQQFREVIREEIASAEKQRPPANGYETPGMTYKPLYKMSEVCSLFHVSKPTIYEWIKLGKLKRVKIRSRVYFLWQDIQQLIDPSTGCLPS